MHHAICAPAAHAAWRQALDAWLDLRGSRAASQPPHRVPAAGACRCWPRVYVYDDLPREFTDDQLARNRAQPPPIYDPRCETNFYAAEVTLHRFLLASPARTLDPRQADWFFVPAYVACFLINNHPNNLTRTGAWHARLRQHLMRQPFFNASHGRDHLFLFAQGYGARLAGDWQAIHNAVFLVHNGQPSAPEYTSGKDLPVPPALTGYPDLRPVAPDLPAALAAMPDAPLAAGSPQQLLAAASRLLHAHSGSHQASAASPLAPRRWLAHFGGTVLTGAKQFQDGMWYSKGVRQYIKKHFRRLPGFRITGTRSKDYLLDMAQ